VSAKPRPRASHWLIFVINCYLPLCNNFNDALTQLLFFSFKSCEHCCFIHQFVDVARKLSRFCKMARRSKALGPCWAIYLASFLVMSPQWWPTNPKDIYSVTLTLCDFVPVLNTWVRKPFDLPVFNQTQCINVFIQVQNICFTRTHYL